MTPEKRITFRIPTETAERVGIAVTLRKITDKKFSLNDWLVEAAEEKLNAGNENSNSEDAGRSVGRVEGGRSDEEVVDEQDHIASDRMGVERGAGEGRKLGGVEGVGGGEVKEVKRAKRVDPVASAGKAARGEMELVDPEVW